MQLSVLADTLFSSVSGRFSHPGETREMICSRRSDDNSTAGVHEPQDNMFSIRAKLTALRLQDPHC